jgi:hypothetical protein
MVLSIGNIDYKIYSKPILTDYFERCNIEYKFIEEMPTTIDTRNAHPSWFKLLAHKILPDYDFIICWDLDLLPKNKNISVLEEFNVNKFCIAYDTNVRLNHNNIRSITSFSPNFKYNGGLIGIPKFYSTFTESVFNAFAPNLYNWPSYEQYYLNESLFTYKIDVHELPDDVNYLYSLPLFNEARLQHYTYTSDAKSKIKDHYNSYFTFI